MDGSETATISRMGPGPLRLVRTCGRALRTAAAVYRAQRFSAHSFFPCRRIIRTC